MAHPKGMLIERCQRRGVQPSFVTRMHGPDHEPTFATEVLVEGDVVATGQGSTKRAAERLAAERALAAMDAEDARSVRPSARAPRETRTGRDERATHASIDVDGGASTDPVTDEPFDGPWPMLETVLAACLSIAHDRIAAGLATDDAREGIERFATTLYKNVLSDLGEIVEDA